MQDDVYDVIVVGLGAAGSAALHAISHRSDRDAKVRTSYAPRRTYSSSQTQCHPCSHVLHVSQILGLEAQPTTSHAIGSSHGSSRIIRLCYQEHPSYVTLLRHCYPMWRDLEAEAGCTLLHKTGVVNISSPGALGMWMTELVPELAAVLTIERQVVGWFKPTDSDEHIAEFPAFLLDDEQQNYYYGFPPDEDGIKIGKYNHLRQRYASADDVDRRITPQDEAVLRAGLETYLPAVGGAPMTKAVVCTFTNSTDGHFLLDTHPRHPQVVVCSACSGHGFKFAPVLGHVLADLAVDGETSHDIALHRLGRDRPGHAAMLESFQTA
jgi:hypothetical protein